VLELNNGSTINRQVVRRDAPITCAACGRAVMRRSRQHRYCSNRCRQYALRENNARTAIKNSAAGQDTGRVTNPPKKVSGFNVLQTAKAGSTRVICGPQRVIHRELIAGRAWHEEVSPDGVTVQVTRFRRAP
jgi:endogenous inhibitor of DNA gyrase (YacG/DUF329 family)